MKKKRVLLAGAAILLLALIFSCIIAGRRAVHEIRFVSQVGYSEGWLYGIDVDENHYYLFRIHTEDGRQDFFSCPMEKNGVYTTLSDLSMDPEGNAYVYRKETDLATGELVSQSVDYCNFRTGKLEPRWSGIGLTEGEQYWFLLTIPKDGVYAVTRKGAQAFWYRINVEGGADFDKQARLPNDSQTVIFGDDKEMWSVNADGDVYKIRDNGSELLIFRNDGSQVGVDNIDLAPEKNELHFKNLTSMKNYKVSLTGGDWTVSLCQEHEKARAKTFDSDTLFSSGSVDEDGIYYGVLPLEDSRQIPAVYGNVREMAVDRLERSWRQTVWEGVFLFFLFAGCGLLWLWAFLRIGRRKNGAPVWGIITLTLLPLLAAAFAFVFYATDQVIARSGREARVRQLTLTGFDIREQIPLELFETFWENDRFTIRDFRELSKVFYRTDGIFWDEETGGGAYLSNPSEALLYFYKDGELYSGNRNYQFNVPMDYLCSVAEYQGMKQAADKNTIVSASFNTMEGQYISVFLPVTGKDGQVAGVVEIREAIQQLTRNNLQNASMVKGQLFLIGGALLLLVQLSLWVGMRPLGQLKKAMMAAARGELQVKAGLKGRSEIAATGRLFDRMTETLREQDEELKAYQRKYEALVPGELLRLIKKKGIREVKAGDAVQIWAAILAVNASDYQLRVQEGQGALFALSSRRLALQIPVIREKGGIIRRLIECGEESIFPEASQGQVLDAAICVLQALEETGGAYSAGIARERLKLGVIGSGKRLHMALISSHGGLSWFLQQMGQRLACPILITGEAAAEIKGFETEYHSRVLGYLYLTEEARLEILYEVLDGEAQERQMRKQETKGRFEEGIDLFMAGRLMDARRQFVHVVEADPEDRAAREYVILCEGLLREENRLNGALPERLLCLDRY